MNDHSSWFARQLTMALNDIVGISVLAFMMVLAAGLMLHLAGWEKFKDMIGALCIFTGFAVLALVVEMWRRGGE